MFFETLKTECSINVTLGYRIPKIIISLKKLQQRNVYAWTFFVFIDSVQQLKKRTDDKNVEYQKQRTLNTKNFHAYKSLEIIIISEIHHGAILGTQTKGPSSKPSRDTFQRRYPQVSSPTSKLRIAIEIVFQTGQNCVVFTLPNTRRRRQRVKCMGPVIKLVSNRRSC